MTAIIGCNIKIKPHDKAWIRVPNRNTNPKQKIPNERPKIETLIKYNKLENSPIEKTFILKIKNETMYPNIKINNPLNKPKKLYAIKYSFVEIGDMNMFVKFFAQIFQRLPTPIE